MPVATASFARPRNSSDSVSFDIVSCFSGSSDTSKEYLVLRELCLKDLLLVFEYSLSDKSLLLLDRLLWDLCDLGRCSSLLLSEMLTN